MPRATTFLTISEAAAYANVKQNAIEMAIYRGKLQSVGSRPKLVAQRDLDRYLVSRFVKRPWTEADDAALLELVETCTTTQIAKYLGRSINSVTGHMHMLKRTGVQWDPRTSVRNPFAIPGSAILLAKTCLHCGKLRDERFFRGGGKGSRSRASGASTCSLCFRKRHREQQRNTPRREDTFYELAQEVSLATADRKGQPYTVADSRVISDLTKSDLQVALELRRTFHAIRAQRQLAGLRSPVTRFPDSHWLINFPRAAEVLRQGFIRLGVPDDGWESEVA